MTPLRLSQIHRAAYSQMRPWDAAEFASLLANPYTQLFVESQGFALVQCIAGEAELLSIAVEPKYQRRGIADRLMAQWTAAVQADAAFLEVAADNFAAQKLYQKHGFSEVARRRGYYQRQPDAAVDAVVMRRDL